MLTRNNKLHNTYNIQYSYNNFDINNTLEQNG